MGARKKRSTETALELLVEQVHIIWNNGTEHIALILNLDISGAFSNISHARLLYNLKKRKTPEYIVG
jgi:retron-type reverse transcriptase